MATNKILTQQEREEVLTHVKPVGQFKPVHTRGGFGMPPIPWEQKLGNLDDYRQHAGMGRAIVPVLADSAKTQSVQNSILSRLKKLYPEESWSTYVEGKSILLKFNGPKRHHASSKNDKSEQDTDSSLFAQTG